MKSFTILYPDIRQCCKICTLHIEKLFFGPKMNDRNIFSFRPGANVIKKFTAVDYEFSELGSVLVPCKPF